jgi:5S rRNA maturation endonuclease (ribonuclease M5)
LEFFIQDEGYFSINQRSLGFRWFFSFLLFTKYRGCRARNTTNVLFLLDEPASNLHTTAQLRLQKSLGEMAKSNYRFIYTTHSQYLINPKWLESTYIVKNEGLSYTDEESIDEFSPQKTKITIHPYRQFVSNYPDQTSYFKPVLDIIDYIPSKLDMVSNVVMLEGKNDFYTLNYFKDCILKMETTYNFLPGLSCEKLFPIIQHYLAWGKKFIVILDSDTAGEDSRKKYLDEFGVILKDRIFSLANIDTNFKNKKLENLIEKTDRIDVQKISKPNSNTYDKKMFNKTLQELYLTKAEYPFSDFSKNNIKSIFDFIDTKI